MKVFLKSYTLALFFIAIVESVVVVQIGYKASSWPIYISILFGGALLVACTHWLTERMLIPLRTKRLLDTMATELDGKLITPDTICFKLNQFSIYAQVYIQIRLSDYGTAMRLISFHVPRQQIDELPHPPYFKLINSRIERVDTYWIYSANSFTLSHAIRQLSKKLDIDPPKNP